MSWLVQKCSGEVPGSDFCPRGRQDEHKDAKGNLEGGLDVLVSQLICAISTKCLFNV